MQFLDKMKNQDEITKIISKCFDSVCKIKYESLEEELKKFIDYLNEKIIDAEFKRYRKTRDELAHHYYDGLGRAYQSDRKRLKDIYKKYFNK